MSNKRSVSTNARGSIHGPLPVALSEDDKYRSKLKALKKKMKDMEQETLATQTKLLKSKQNILRLRLERSFLFERLTLARQQGLGLDVPSNGQSYSVPAANHHAPLHPSANGDLGLRRQVSSIGANGDAQDDSHRAKRAPSTESSASTPSLPIKTGSFARPQAASSSATTGRKTKREMDNNAPKRPTNAFLRFCDVVRPQMKQDAGDDVMTDYTKVLGAKWAAMPESEKKPYQEAYAAARKQYDSEMREYIQTKVPAPSSVNAAIARERGESLTPSDAKFRRDSTPLMSSDGPASSPPQPSHHHHLPAHDSPGGLEKKRTQVNPKSLANLKRGGQAKLRALAPKERSEDEMALEPAGVTLSAETPLGRPAGPEASSSAEVREEETASNISREGMEVDNESRVD